MKLKQLLISTTSIAAIAVVPISIVSCGNNNNNAVEELPSKPGGDNNTQKPDGDNSNTGSGDNNTQKPDGDNSNTGSGDNNNQEPAIQYIDVNSKEEMISYILNNNYIVSEFIRQVLKRQIGEVTSVDELIN